MTNSHLLAGLLALLFLLCGATLSASAQDRVRLPSQQHSSVRSTQDVELHSLPSVNTEALQREDEARADEIGPYRYGTVVETDLAPRHHGTWDSLPGGHWLWRLRIQSRNAVSLSVVFTEFDLPKGATLFVYGPDRELVRGPYTRDDATAGQHRTPLVRGENLIVEVKVPRNQRSRTNLVIGKVVHGYRSIERTQASDAGSKAGDCNIDVACDEADPWRDQVASVARYTFESGTSTFVCSGSLVNTTAENKVPYFLTAEHCISTPEEAQSMVFYWNYQNPTCRTPGTLENGQVTSDDPADQTSSGALLRARYGNVHDQGTIEGKPDLSLVEIDDFVPPSYDLYFNGWSRVDTPPQSSVTIHHPQGHGKRISFDDDPSTVTGYLSEDAGTTHLRIAAWDLGTTEGGSSGSPLFNDNQRVVGVLSGGAAGCSSTSSGAEDNNEPDWYGRVRPGFTNGDFEGATLADWLDPTNSGATAIDGVSLLDPDDDTAPSPIDDLTVSSLDTTSMTLTWTAPGDDGDQGRAYQYELRFATSMIDSEADFSSAQSVASPPIPETASSTQQVEVTGLVPDSTYYFAIRAIDDGGNAAAVTSTDGTLLPDITPPAPITNVRITGVNTSALSVTLEWTATGDDGRRGRASTYDLRYASEPITSVSDFEQATPLPTNIPPAEAGVDQSVVVDETDGLEEDQTYHFALRAKDNAGNATPVATPQETAVLTRDIRVQKGGPLSAARGRAETTFVVTKTQNVRIELYDLLGRRVRVLFDDQVPEGFEQVVRYDVNDLSSGPYFLRFTGDTFTKTRQIMVVN